MYNEIEMFDLQNIREKKNLSSVCVSCFSFIRIS